MTFDLIPESEIRVNDPDFKSSHWKPTTVRGESGWEYSMCYELLAGRWEGFVSIRRRPTRDRKPLPASILSLAGV